MQLVHTLTSSKEQFGTSRRDSRERQVLQTLLGKKIHPATDSKTSKVGDGVSVAFHYQTGTRNDRKEESRYRENSTLTAFSR